MGNCHCITKDKGDNQEFYKEDFQNFEDEISGFENENPQKLKSTKKPKTTEEEILKIKDLLNEKLKNQNLKDEIIIEEITKEEFEEKLKKNEESYRCLKTNENETKTFMFEGDEKALNYQY